MDRLRVQTTEKDLTLLFELSKITGTFAGSSSEKEQRKLAIIVGRRGKRLEQNKRYVVDFTNIIGRVLG